MGFDDNNPKFIYNDGDYQIEPEVFPDPEKSYYTVYENYKQNASFKHKKDALIYVGIKNTLAKKEIAKEAILE